MFITSSISAGTGSSWSLWRPVGMWCDAALLLLGLASNVHCPTPVGALVRSGPVVVVAFCNHVTD